MATIGGIDLSGLVGAVKQGVGDLMSGFKTDAANPALSGLGGGEKVDLWAGLSYGQNPALGGLGGGSGQNPALSGLGGASQGNPALNGLGGSGWGASGGMGVDLAQSIGNNPLWQGAENARNAWGQQQAQQQAAEQARRQATMPGAASAGGLGTAQWADLINQEAAKYGDAPDLAEVAQAVAELESKGNANAQGVVVTSGPYAGQRAQGLMQIMPGNYPGVNLLDPRTNVQKGLEMLYQRYKQYGDWDKAVASYFGAIDGNGNITGSQDDNGTSGFSYVNTVNQHRATIRAARQTATTGTGGTVPPAMASIWGGGQAGITQQYGVVTPGIDQGIYTYGAAYGLPAGHTGADIGLKRGTALYMPAGLTGTVEIAGGSGVFKDEGGGDPGNLPGKGELRIRLSNGDILIMGHTSAINVRVGQQVGAGALVGASGTANGDHLHLEVRQRQADGSYRLVNPAAYFGSTGGNSTGIR